MKLQEIKRPIRAFLKNFSDERLAALLAHAQDGKLSFYSCCCLKGALTADHALQPYMRDVPETGHYALAGLLPGSEQAEIAFRDLGYKQLGVPTEPHIADALRRRRIIPMIKAEIGIRERERKFNYVDSNVLSGSLVAV